MNEQLPARACAYCGKVEVKLTKEHLWPAALHRRINASNLIHFGEKNQFYLQKINKIISGEPQVKDVCASCNNGPLSALDDYTCKMWDQYFNRIVEHRKQVKFEYEYDQLVRWLLKMSYNSARIHESDTQILQTFREYMLGAGFPPENIVVHLQLIKPKLLSKEDVEKVEEQGFDLSYFEPRVNRIGHFGYKTRQGYGRLTRAVYLQSYMFIIHMFTDRFSKAERASNLEDFSKIMPYAKRLHRARKFCFVSCRGIDALESYFIPPIES